MKMAHQIISDSFINPHKILHGNISILINFHPAPEGFKDVFKENMFMLPNKKGFYEVTNYINSIIDKEKWSPIIAWPVLDNKDEMKFRRAVVNFTADLNALYDVHILPTMNASVLMGPGGLQVARFIVKLSEYAIRKFMEQSLGFENTLQCLKYSISPNVKLKLETVSLHENVQCLKELERKSKNYNYGLQKRECMQQQLLKICKSNEDIEREIAQLAPDNNYSKEQVQQRSNELNKRVENRQNYVNYLASIEESVNRYHQAANRVLEKEASNLILDGFKIIQSSTENNQTSSTDLTSYFKSSAAIARRLALKLKSSESTLEDSQVAQTGAQRIVTEISLENMKLEVLEKDILNAITESQRAINELEPKAFYSVMDNEKIPPEIQNYTASPHLSLVKPYASARLLPLNVCRKQGTGILDWVKNNLIKETKKVRSNINTPLKRERVSLIPKKGLIAQKIIGLGVHSKQSPSRAPQTPKRNSFGPARRLIQEAKAETPKPHQLEEEDSIVLPHNLSVSTASPGNNSTCATLDTPKGDRWQRAAPSTAYSADRQSNAASSITSPNTWAEQNGVDFLSSTPYFITNNNNGCISATNNISTCSSAAENQSHNFCHSSPSRFVHLPTDTSATSQRHTKMRPSIENIIARYKALKRNQLENSQE